MSVDAMNNRPSYRTSMSGPSSQPAPTPQPQQDNPLLRVISSLFESGKYSDLVIKCQGQRWKAHRAVVCSQSRPLAAAIDGNFRESATGEIDLEDDEPTIIAYMLEYFYKGNISIDATVGTSQNPIDLESKPQNSSSAPSVRGRQQNSDLGRISFPANNPSNNSGWYPQPLQSPVSNSTPSLTSLPFGYTNSNQGINSSFSSVSFTSSNPLTSYPPARNGVTGLFSIQDNQYEISMETRILPRDQPSPTLMQTRLFPRKRPGSPSISPTVNPTVPTVHPQNLVILAAIYVAAEKYDVQPLKLLAQTKYEAILTKAWNTEHFVKSLEVIYDGTPEMSEPDSLRDLAIKTAATHATELMARGDFKDLCKDRGDLTTEVLQASLLQSQAAVADAARLGGSGIPRCRNNISHPVYINTPRTYGPPMAVRYKCAVCNSFLD